MEMKKLCFVVQRYGREILGGAEMLCAQYIAHLKSDYEICVATSCAKDYNTWANEYPEGRDDVDGVPVFRFKSIPRNAALFQKLDAEVYGDPNHSIDTAAMWLREVGPRCPGLLRFIEKNKDAFDVFLFVGYHYYTSTFGMPLAAGKAVFIPTAHDEPPLRACNYFKYLFQIPEAILYLAEEEKNFVQGYFHNESVPYAVAGSGVTPPGELVMPAGGPEGPYILYTGRIDHTKNCGELLENFTAYKDKNPSRLRLVLAGQKGMELPEREDVTYVGFVNEGEKFGLIQNARAFVMPSENESLSISTLEAMYMQTPVLLCGRSAVLKRHAVDSNAGLYYDAQEGFIDALHAILADEGRAAQMGANGRAYVEKNYQWDSVLVQIKGLIEKTGEKNGL